MLVKTKKVGWNMVCQLGNRGADRPNVCACEVDTIEPTNLVDLRNLKKITSGAKVSGHWHSVS
jgi:hypothetical protein